MSEHIEELTELMKEIKDNGWHESKRKGNTGIGKTFEDLLGKDEDNESLPDFKDIEIKTHETKSSSLLTLFTKAPSYPRGANTIIRESYGILDSFGNKTVHVTISGNKPTKSNKYEYDFMSSVDWENKKVSLLVYDKLGNLIDDSIYWKFEDMENQIVNKLKYIGVVGAESKEVDGNKYYKYNNIDLVRNLTVESLCKGIEDGKVKIDIRIGAFKTGKKKGMTHDHGTAFRINVEDLLKYADVEHII